MQWLVLLLAAGAVAAEQQQRQQYAPLELPRRGGTSQADDWLVSSTPSNTTARLLQLDARTLALSNGLVARVFTLQPEWSTWDIVSAGRGSALRAPAPEATVTLDFLSYPVGGLRIDLNASSYPSCKQSADNWYPSGQKAEACPTGWWNRSMPLLADATAFQYVGHAVTAPEAPFAWKPARHAPDAAWPPRGLLLAANFTAPQTAPPQHRGVIVTVHYQLLDGAPLMSKWVSVHLPRRSDAQSRASTTGPLGGALSIHSCNTNPAAAPAEWGFVWILPKVGATNGSIQLGGKSSARKLCMTVVSAPVGFSNADVGLRPCNASDRMQGWSWDNNAGTLQTLAPPEQLRAANIKGCLDATSASSCCLDVNAHVNTSGQAMQMDDCKGTGSWGSFAPLTSTLGTMLKSVGSGSCVFSTPLPPPPKPPAPPPPRPACHTGVGGDCVVVRHVTVEILRLNRAWASTEKTMPYEQTDITQDVPAPGNRCLTKSACLPLVFGSVL